MWWKEIENNTKYRFACIENRVWMFAFFITNHNNLSHSKMFLLGWKYTHISNKLKLSMKLFMLVIFLPGIVSDYKKPLAFLELKIHLLRKSRQYQ